MTYNKSDDAIQAIYRPPTPTRNETIPFFSHPYPFIPHTHSPTDLYRWKVTCHDNINAENQKLLLSLTHKWYRWLIINLMMQFKPYIDLELQLETKLYHFSVIHNPLFLTPTVLQISINEKSHVMTTLMLKIKNFSFRSHTNGIDDLWYILCCNSSYISTSNSN